MATVSTGPRTAIQAAAGPARCPWCRAPTADAVATGRRRVRCASCGVQLTWPWPDAAELDAAYADWYRPEDGRFSGPGDAVLGVTRGLLARRLDRVAPAGPLVDVGAGDGHLLAAARRRGRPVLGLERRPSGPELRDASLEELEREVDAAEAAAARSHAAAAFPSSEDAHAGGERSGAAALAAGERPAAIVLWHVIEHLPDPRSAIEAAARLLRPGGVLVIACPNADSRQAAGFGDGWLAWDQPRHLVHLTRDALVSGVEASGLDVERVGHLRAGQSVFCALHGLVGRTPGAADLYDAIRRPEARQAPVGRLRRAWTGAVAAGLLPVAAAGAVLEAADGRGAGLYLEARRPASGDPRPPATARPGGPR